MTMQVTNGTHLFVYGTLMSGYHNPFAVALRSSAELLGEATLPGRMFLVTANRAFTYPAVVESDDAGQVVHGELFRLSDPAVLERLDAYEGPEYERVVRQATLTDGSTHDTLVYLYRGSTEFLRPIPSGRFADAAA